MTLLKTKAYINGEWCDAISGKKTAVINPATHEMVGYVPDMGAEETASAIDAAHSSFRLWKNKTAGERASLLRKWHDLILENADELAAILTAEQGKPLAESLGEIKYGASYFDWFAEEARRIYGDVIAAPEANKRIVVLKQPVGVVGIITPWNFPNAMIARKLAAALAAGCTVVIKPAEATPLSALALIALGEKAGLPAGVVNIITTNSPAEVGSELTANDLVKKLSFTGSTQIGKLLIKQAADTVKKVTMELGGNAPFIVFNDASIDDAVRGAMQSKFRNAGQTCVCANRFYVQSGVYDAFLSRFLNAVSALTVGNGAEKGIEIGPLINENAVEKVELLLRDGVEKGATIALGGKRHALGGTFFEPTVVIDASPEMRFAKEEIFGPVAPIFKFETEEEVVTAANDTEFGLAAYFYGENRKQIGRVAEELAYGMVGINTGLISTAVAPFGGIKQSGTGREGSKYGLDDYLQLKYMSYEL